jgi:hypothetical protein
MLSMITPGRRALGEDWSQVDIGTSGDEITLEVAPAEAPAHNRPIIVVNEGEAEMTAYILEASIEKAKELAKRPEELTAAERHEMLNAAWQDYIGDKLAHLQGRSTLGAGGLVQRQRVNRPNNI